MRGKNTHKNTMQSYIKISILSYLPTQILRTAEKILLNAQTPVELLSIFRTKRTIHNRFNFYFNMYADR